MQPFLIPDDFRAFMKQVVAYLDAPSDEPKFLDAEDALQDETGYGGRVEGDVYRFSYISPNGHAKWTVQLSEAAIRDIADGLLIEVMGERFDIVRSTGREPKGHPLLIWGEYADDALSVRDRRELERAFDAVRALAEAGPRMVRAWSATDDQIVAMVHGDVCALYVIESLDGYATSCGDPRRTDSFEAFDYDGRPFVVPYTDCVPWAVAREALLRFVERGDLGPAVRTEGRVPTGLLMMGEVTRAEALAARAEPPRRLSQSSIPRLFEPEPAARAPTTPEPASPEPAQAEPRTETEARPLDDGAPETLPEAAAPPPIVDAATGPMTAVPPLLGEELAAWARRLVELLHARALIELGRVSLDEITYQLGGLLQAHGDEAQRSLDTAEWLANEIGAVRGIDRMYATAGDLQLALRRSRSP
jgi:hypothetical protein